MRAGTRLSGVWTGLLLLAILIGTPALAATPAGSITLLTGQATAADPSGQIRALYRGGPVYSGEVIMTGPGSYLNMVFSDGGRVLLRPESRFMIARYEYSAATSTSAQTHESAFFRLLKGGFRAISGLIGHVHHDDYAVQTPVATIGIRGTDYEVRYCDNDCGDVQPQPQNGLFLTVEGGQIMVTNTGGQLHPLSVGQFLFVAPTGGFQPLTQRPPALGTTPLPDPRTCN